MSSESGSEKQAAPAPAYSEKSAVMPHAAHGEKSAAIVPAANGTTWNVTLEAYLSEDERVLAELG